jgi:hypothetical protein
MLQVYKKRQVHTSKPGILGGRIQTIDLGGRVFEVKRHKMHGLHIQPSHYAVSDPDSERVVLRTREVLRTRTHAEGMSQQPVHSSIAPGNSVIPPSKANTKKKLSSILRGGALAPL